MTLSEKVDQTKEEFIYKVNALKYATTLIGTISDGSIEDAVRNVVTSYENYVNSKIEFTAEHFKNI